jgi:hypothetical protein
LEKEIRSFSKFIAMKCDYLSWKNIQNGNNSASLRVKKLKRLLEAPYSVMFYHIYQTLASLKLF